MADIPDDEFSERDYEPNQGIVIDVIPDDTCDQNLVEENQLPNHDSMINLISQFFSIGNIGSKVGELYEKNVSDTLSRSGYQRFPIIKLDGTLNVTLGSGKEYFSEKPRNPYGEIDSMVCGDQQAFKQLRTLCPYCSIREPFHAADVQHHILVCEAKTSYKEAVRKMSTSKHEANKEYWIFEDTGFPYCHKVLFVNGGEDSKNWVMNGGKFPDASARNVWNALADSNVSIFYRESFSQEWVIQATQKLNELERKVAHVDELERKVAYIDALERKVAHVDALETVVDDLKKTVAELVKKVGGTESHENDQLG